MEEGQEIPDSIPCPYCGAGNTPDSEFCAGCYKQLHIPAEVRAAVKARKIMAAASGVQPVKQAPAGEARPESRFWGRLVLIAVLFLFYLQWFKKENYFSPLDLLNLPFHEAGHVFLGFFGRFIMMLGGSIFQLLIPAVCLVHLKRRGANLGWQLCLFWLGQSLLNISVYAGDAVKKSLPLVGGGEHDWAYLLGETGLLSHAGAVSNLIFLAGSAVIFYSFYLIGLDAQRREPVEFGNIPWGMK